MRRSATILVMFLGVLFAPMAAAHAQAPSSEYPIRRPAQVQSFGAQRVGDTFSKKDCGFQAGASAQIRLNDTAAGTKNVGSDGCVNLVVRVTAQDKVTIDGTEYTARRCADNTIFVTAQASGNASEQQQIENRFRINCQGVGAGALPRTGSDVTDLAGLGGVLTIVGAVVLMIVRRRRRSDTATA